MTTNSRTWFYTEPEHRPYYIEERVNQNLWASRFGSIYLDCVRAEPPFRMEGVWNEIALSIEWVPNTWFTLRASQEDRTWFPGLPRCCSSRPHSATSMIRANLSRSGIVPTPVSAFRK